MRVESCWAFLCGLFLSGAIAAMPAAEDGLEGWSFKPIVEARLRAELFETPLANPTQDRGYGLLVGRARAGGELAWGGRFAFRGIVQGAAASGVPDNAAFGAGATMFSTNLGDRSPGQLDLSELAVFWKAERFVLGVGRQAWTEGGGPATGVAHLDFVRSRRLAERLVGTVEFANVARRFEGLTFAGKATQAGTFEGFALRPLGGVLQYDEAFHALDIEVLGAAWSTPFGTWIPGATARLFAQRYRDERGLVLRTLGDEIELATYGGSLLAGAPSWDFLAWCAVQRGDYGVRSHRAWAAVAEVGRRFVSVQGEPSIHLAWEKASGGDRPGENRNFWNGLPTNHRYYDLLDYFAFSNLQDLFIEARWSPAKNLNLSALVHDFRLADRSGPWVSGSGPMSDRELGYALRRPAHAGSFTSSELGRELDLVATWSFAEHLTLKLEVGKFFGGSAAKESFPKWADGSWVGLELNWML